MKFVDEATIQVTGGKGGDGCISFRREKFIPRGGPDGGDGGKGGSIYLRVNAGLNTLADFRQKSIFQAQNGRAGMGCKCSGSSGQDLYIAVPLGTLVYDQDTDELICDLKEQNEALLVAKGGRHGLGNTRFKSSTNRAPRKHTKGELGEQRTLRLELSVLADVGLLGLPNAGKSTLIRKVSSSRAKVADYPFTTLYPNLGVVDSNRETRFIIADIPGLIRGAAQGLGLGISFLKHLSRTRLLLHLVDISTENDIAHILSEIVIIEQELRNYSADLLKKERWLALNKSDTIPITQAMTLAEQTKKRLGTTVTAVFVLSGLTGYGCQELIHQMARWLATTRQNQHSES